MFAFLPHFQEYLMNIYNENLQIKLSLRNFQHEVKRENFKSRKSSVKVWEQGWNGGGCHYGVVLVIHHPVNILAVGILVKLVGQFQRNVFNPVESSVCRITRSSQVQC